MSKDDQAPRPSLGAMMKNPISNTDLIAVEEWAEQLIRIDKKVRNSPQDNIRLQHVAFVPQICRELQAYRGITSPSPQAATKEELWAAQQVIMDYEAGNGVDSKALWFARVVQRLANPSIQVVPPDGPITQYAIEPTAVPSHTATPSASLNIAHRVIMEMAHFENEAEEGSPDHDLLTLAQAVVSASLSATATTDADFVIQGPRRRSTDK